MSKHIPLVSFCVPTYGRAAFIGQTLSSVLEQTVDDFEVIVVDDKSPDYTAEVVKGFLDTRIRYIRNAQNLGVPENLNRAMSLAEGEYLVLLEDHDLVEPRYLEATLTVMKRYPGVGFVATGLITIDEGGYPKERYVENLGEFMPGRELLRRILIRTDCPFPVTTVIRRSALMGIDPLFDPKYWWYADQYLWLRLCGKSDFGYVAEPLLRFRMREVGHYLAGRDWESRLCLQRIHRDNWYMLHPEGGLKSWRDELLYEKAKFVEIAMLQAGRMMRNESWTEEDDRFCQSYISPFSCLLLRVARLLPARLITRIRGVYRKYQHRNRRVDEENMRSAKMLEFEKK